MSDDPDDKVGYRRPPRQSQFQPGQSGNPNGRPKGARNLATLLGAALGEKVSVSENGKRKKISKLDAVVRQLVNKAASGEHRAIQQLLALVNLVEGRGEGKEQQEPVLSEADREIIESLAERVLGTKKP